MIPTAKTMLNRMGGENMTHPINWLEKLSSTSSFTKVSYTMILQSNCSTESESSVSEVPNCQVQNAAIQVYKP